MFPRAIEAITPEWLTQALQADGCLGGARVSAVESTPLGAGVGFMSAMSRLTLTYDGEASGAPRSLIAKLSPLDPGARQIDQAFKFYERETGFYRTVSKQTPMRSPRAHHISFDAESHDFCLLLEDMAPARMADQLVGLTPEEAAMAVRAAARLHARWWRSPELESMDWLLWINSPAMKSLEPIYQQCWGPTVDFLGDRMPTAVRAAGDRLSTRIAGLLDEVRAMPTTMVHGDFRADNMFFHDDADQIRVVDWQIVMRGGGVFDIAYMLAGSLGVEDRRRGEMDLLRLYHGALTEGGVTDYPLRQCIQDYRLCIMLAWCWPVVAIGSLDPANARGVAFFKAWCDRAMAAIIDLDAAEFLV